MSILSCLTCYSKWCIIYQIFTYNGNSVLLELGLETMFDVNSIMSNMLQ